MSPGSSTENYPAFARIGVRENSGRKLNQVTCPDQDSNPSHLVSRPDELTVTSQVIIVNVTMKPILIIQFALKMTGNVAPVRAVSGRTQDNSHCRRCHCEDKTLAHVLGSCPFGKTLRNSRHHKIRIHTCGVTVSVSSRETRWPGFDSRSGQVTWLSSVPSKVAKCNIETVPNLQHDANIGILEPSASSSSTPTSVLLNVDSSEFQVPSKTSWKERKNLSFQKRWLQRWKWLAYSDKQNGAFCKYCVLFAPQEVGMHKATPTGRLVNQPFDNWKHACETFNRHEKLQYHLNSVDTYTKLKSIEQGNEMPVSLQIDKARREQGNVNVQRILPIIKTVIFCGRQGIPLRGHKDFGPFDFENPPNHNEGNFRALLRERVDAGDDNLKSHLLVCGKNASYISWKTQNEIISACNYIIRSQIVVRVNEARCFAILADESVDVSGTEQFSLSVRFLENDSIREEFLQFIPVSETTGINLARTILESLTRFNVDLKYMRGQGYNGASAMSGQFQGAQAFILKECPAALYVHCASHSLNLAISDACCVPEIRNCIGIVGKVCEFFNTPKRQDVLINSIKELCPENKRSKLVQMCATRWIERHDTVMVLMELMDAVLPALKTISLWTDKDVSSKADMLHSSVTKPAFLISLHVSDAAENQFKSIFSTVSAQLTSLGEEIRIPRCASGQRSQFRSNVPADNAEEYYRRTVFLPFLSNMQSQIKTRFAKHNNILTKFLCLMKEDGVTSDFIVLAKFYSQVDTNFCVQDKELVCEFELWNTFCKGKQYKSVWEMYIACEYDFYPHVKELLKILLTLPVSTSTSERSFSTLKRLKSYLRNTMGNECLNGLALLNIHRDITVSPQDFVTALKIEPRRLDFVL
ncbi:hypothetical protein ANN_21034 [Periplaneta americana]|uniref:TTF-type domain-containing protein n=1 Tax=Periplaneta americana TaxID=6978 RepID=A0ABQ8SED6_PERAM|nr:hypothetical protein ANN_21034 [Periplaneta americana]